MTSVPKLGRGSVLSSKLRPSDLNPRWPRQEIGRTAPPGLLLCAGPSSDKELSGEEELGTRKICTDVENRKWPRLGFSLLLVQAAPGTQQRGRRGQRAWISGYIHPLCQALQWALGSQSACFPGPHHPGRRPTAVKSLGCSEILQSQVLGAWESLREETMFDRGLEKG